MIYLDHAATTPVRAEVLKAMTPYFSDAFSNASSLYADARRIRHSIDQARSEIASAIGAKRNEVYFTSGGTESDNWAVFGAALANPNKKHIITTRIEHHAVLYACEALQRHGYTVTYIDPDNQGRISVRDVERAICDDTLLISVMLANNEIGTIEPVSQIASIAKAHGVLMHTDAVQAAGHIPVNVRELNVDLLSISAHKFYGPKGIGALYIREGVRIGHMLQGGAQERGMRPGTENTAGIVGMAKALTLACEEMDAESIRIASIRERLEAAASMISGVYVNGSDAQRLPGHLHLTIDEANTSLLLMQLDMAGIAASGGSACASGAQERSHVMHAIGHHLPNQADIRLTIGKDNTENDIDTAAEVLRRCLKR